MMLQLRLIHRSSIRLRATAERFRQIAADCTPQWRHLVTISPFALIVILFFARLGHRELYSSHEARAAQNAQRMIDTGEWGLPVLFDGRIDHQKPPGYYWAVAAIGCLNGGTVSEWVVRLPAALSGLLCSLMVYAFLRQAGRPVAAVVAMIALATANHYIGIARTARIDVPLTCAITCSLLAFYRGCRPLNVTKVQEESRHWFTPIAWHFLAAVAAAIAVMLKGPVGPALIGPAALLWLVMERYSQTGPDRPRVPIASWLMIPIVAATLGLPWFIYANETTNGEFFRVFFWHHTVDRFTGNSPLLASHPWWYYAPRFAVDFLPWTPLLNCLALWSIRTGRWRSDPHFRIAFLSCMTMIFVLSTAQFKRSDYLLPAFPFAAIALGCAAETWLTSRISSNAVRAGRWVFGGLIGAAVVCWLAMLFVIEPTEQKRETKRKFAALIRSHAPAPHTILQFRMESHLLTYHLGRPVYTFMEWHELNEILAQPGPHFVVMQAEYVYPASEIIKSRKLIEIARGQEFAVGKPVRPLVFLRTAD